MNDYPVVIKMNKKERALLIDSAQAGRTYVTNYATQLAGLSEGFDDATWQMLHAELDSCMTKLKKGECIYIVMSRNEGLVLTVLFYPFLTYKRQSMLDRMRRKLQQFVPAKKV